MGKSKKDCPLTARVTEDELKQIKEKANAQNLSVSRFIVEKSLEPEAISISIMREAYQHICTIRDLAANWKFSEDEIVNKEISKECDALCRILRS